MTSDKKNNIIPFPSPKAQQEEVQRMRDELVERMVRRDDLLYVECRNIETKYMLLVGVYEVEGYELDLDCRRLKRKIEMIQASLNRMEKVDFEKIEKTLDEEFEKYQQLLSERLNDLNNALERSRFQFLSLNEASELKRLYREIVKASHPDLNPHTDDQMTDWFLQAVEAYENGDLETVRVLHVLVLSMKLESVDPSDYGLLKSEKDRLKKWTLKVEEEIRVIETTIPYTLKEIIEDPDAVEERVKQLKDWIDQLKEMKEAYLRTIKEQEKINHERH